MHEERPVPLATLNRVSDNLSAVFSILAGLCIIVLMGLSSFDVIRRSLLNQSIPGVNEIIEVVLAIVIFLGVAGAQTSGSQIATPIVTNLMPARLGHAVRTFAGAIATFIVIWMLIETLKVGIASYQSNEFRFGLANIPVWPARLMIPVGLLGLAVALVVQTFTHLYHLIANSPKAEVEYADF